MSHKANPVTESPAEKSARLRSEAKNAIDRIAEKAAQDPNYFGTPSVEMVLQNGAVTAIKVNDQQSFK